MPVAPAAPSSPLAAPAPVRLDATGAAPLLDGDDLAAVVATGGEVGPALAWVRDVAPRLPHPGGGSTAALWSALASVAAQDVAVARVLEPHLDARAILAQAPPPLDLAALGATSTSTWGVFAAEGPGVRLEAHASPDGGWRLTGVKPWCSLAADLSHALVTAWTDDGRRLLAVALDGPGVVPDAGPWVPRGLPQVVSAPVTFDDAPAVPVGATGWYLERPGFAWGGIGVAACWYGGAVGVARTLHDALCRREPDPLALAHLGAVDVALTGARAVLAEAAGAVDAGVDGPASSVLARRARTVVADAVDVVLARCARALGPGPLTTDEPYARRTADLALYVRQHHAERDLAALGRDLLAAGERPW